MAKFQINKLKVFGGFFVPYISKRTRQRLKKLRKTNKSKLKKTKVRAKVAILGGGDVIFPIIAAGVMMKTFSNIIPAILVILGALAGLSYLFFFGKKKPYPAMPYISAGIFIAIGLSYLFFR